MKKTARKLVLRSETLRLLADIDLSRVMGGGDSRNGQCLGVVETTGAVCTTTAAVDSGAVACTTTAVVDTGATTTCR